MKGTTQMQRRSGWYARLKSISGVPFTYLVDPATKTRATPASQEEPRPYENSSRDHIRPVGRCRALEYPSARYEVDFVGYAASRAGIKPGLQMRSSRHLEARPILEAPVVDGRSHE